MTILFKILFRVVVYEFYKINVSFFFLMFCLLIGTQYNPVEIFTYQFVSTIAGSEVFILIFLSIVALYSRKCLVFFLHTIADSRNVFFYYLPLVNRLRILASTSLTFLMLLMPVALYALLIIIVAVSMSRFYAVVAILLFYIVLIWYLAAFVLQRISRPLDEYKGGLRISPLGRSRFYYMYFINFFLNRKKLIFISTKVLSVLTLVGVINLYFTDQYPMILIHLGMLVSTMLHFVLVFDLRKFEDEYLMILRNLPMRSTVYIVYVFTYFLMILPELIVLGAYPLSPQYNIVFVALFGISILLFLHSITYYSSLRMNLFFRNSLIFFIVIYLPCCLRFR